MTHTITPESALATTQTVHGPEVGSSRWYTHDLMAYHHLEMVDMVGNIG